MGTFIEFVDYYSPALIQLGALFLLLGFLLFCAIISITLVKWGYSRTKLDKYGRHKLY
jgi:hypothetical protein